MEIYRSKELKRSVRNRCGIELDITSFSSIDSTNTWSLDQCSTDKALPFVCFADSQTQGKGRRGKRWLMSPDANIAMSMCWPFDLPYQSLQLLPLSVAIAIVKTLEAFEVKQAQIKWPNDVYVCGKKIAGVLIEAKAKKSTKPTIAAVIGIGLNVDMQINKNEMSEHDVQAFEQLPAFTDMVSQIEILASDLTRVSVAEELLAQLILVCQNYQKNTAHYLDEFRSTYDYCLNKSVDITLDNGDVVTGLAQGVNDDAELIVNVETEHNGTEQKVFNSAEVSVRPVIM